MLCIKELLCLLAVITIEPFMMIGYLMSNPRLNERSESVELYVDGEVVGWRVQVRFE